MSILAIYMVRLALVVALLDVKLPDTELIPINPPSPTAETPGTPAPATPTLPDWQQQRAEAARLLNRATFGATPEAIDEVLQRSPGAWVDYQLALPATSHLQYMRDLESFIAAEDIWREHRIEAWWQTALRAEDQLRQRVAFALSEIFVLSDRSNFGDDQRALANYYDLLAQGAFGNYRDLLEAVTLSPLMGMYLSMLGNEKPDVERNIRPDENYARECMQLFSIGLVELNPDGSERLDSMGRPIPTYDQSTIAAYAHVYTGWNFAGTQEDTWWHWWDNYDSINPMTAVDAYHDKGEKQLLGGVVLPAGQSAEDDLQQALDSLYYHPNVGPFIGRQLIQKLVTSNPSPAYVARVTAVFNNNGAGERGDLGAVVKAILLDPEASAGVTAELPHFGKLREPLLKATHLWRAFDAYTLSGRIQMGWPSYYFNQAPLSSPSVFNFFAPDYTAPGTLADAGLLGPEFQIMTDSYTVRGGNFMAYYALWAQLDEAEANEYDILLDLREEIALADDPEALLNHLDTLLLGGTLSVEVREILLDALAQDANEEADYRVQNLLFLIMNSPQYAIQK